MAKKITWWDAAVPSNRLFPAIDYEISVVSGSPYVMQGPTRWDYQHLGSSNAAEFAALWLSRPECVTSAPSPGLTVRPSASGDSAPATDSLLEKHNYAVN